VGLLSWYPRSAAFGVDGWVAPSGRALASVKIVRVIVVAAPEHQASTHTNHRSTHPPDEQGANGRR